MSGLPSSPRILAGMIIALLLVAGGIGAYLLLNDDVVDNPEDTGPVNTKSVDLKSSITLNRTTYFKGEPLVFDFEISINDTVVLNSLSIQVHDPAEDRYANHAVQLDLNLTQGEHKIKLTSPPAFSEEGFVAFTFQEYRITVYEVHVSTGQIFSGVVDQLFEVNDYPKVDGLVGAVWEEESNKNASFSISNDTISVYTINNSTASLELSFTRDFSSYARVNFEAEMGVQDSVTLAIGSTTVPLTWNNSSGYIPTGNIQGNNTLKLIFSLNYNSSANLSLSLPTQKAVLFAVVASNYWTASTIDDLPFFEPQYYVNQTSSRFEDTFNVSILVIDVVRFNSSPSDSNFFNLLDEARVAVGSELALPNGSWNLTIGTSPQNAGADLLLVMTNKTMSNLGIVIGNYGEAYNAALHARGSLNTGNYRLISSLADNLVQHEISHVLGAPDRFTNVDAPSVMTKSRPEDAFTDILFGRFWLTLTTWLEEDIQSMYQSIDLYR